MWAEIYDRVAELILSNRTTLVFVSTRRMSERVAFALDQASRGRRVLPHHGSLSRELPLRRRASLEERAARGRRRDRVARTGHRHRHDRSGRPARQPARDRRRAAAHRTLGSLGRGEARRAPLRDDSRRTGRVRCARARDPRPARSMRCACPLRRSTFSRSRSSRLRHARLARRRAVRTGARRRTPTAHLEREDFDDVVTMLADGVATSRGRSGTFLHYDRVNGIVRGRRGARLAAITSGGAIPETANYNVVAEPDGHVVGTLDEDFAVESMAGDIFLLGTTSWRIRRVEPGVVRVEDAHGAPPSIPFWNGEGLGRTLELSREVSALRAAIDERDDAAAAALLARRVRLRCGRRRPSRRLHPRGKAVLGVVPTDVTIVAERFFDEAGGMQLILHTPFGARINRAWGLALRKKLLPRVQLRTPGRRDRQRHRASRSTEQHAFPLDAVFDFCQVGERRTDADASAARRRRCSPRGGAGTRRARSRFCACSGGKKVAAAAACGCAPTICWRRSSPIRPPAPRISPARFAFPITCSCARRSTTVCTKRWISTASSRSCARSKRGEHATVAVDTPEPSAVLPRDPQRQSRTPISTTRRSKNGAPAPCTLRRTLADGRRRRRRHSRSGRHRRSHRESWPVVRDADELHDALATLIVAAAGSRSGAACFEELVAQRRATTLHVGERAVLGLRRTARPVRAVYPVASRRSADRRRSPALAARRRARSRVAEIVRGLAGIERSRDGRGTRRTLRARAEAVARRCCAWKPKGQVLRGRFRSATARNGATGACWRASTA